MFKMSPNKNGKFHPLYIEKTHKISEIFKKNKENVQALINIDTMNSISDKPTFYWDYQKKEYRIMVRIGAQVHT